MYDGTLSVPWRGIRNLTPHPIRVRRLDGSFLELGREFGSPPRISTVRESVGEIEGCAVTRTTFGETIDLPAPQEGVWLVVSRMVRDANPTRVDLLSVGELIRDADGRVVGADGFSV